MRGLIRAASQQAGKVRVLSRLIVISVEKRTNLTFIEDCHVGIFAKLAKENARAFGEDLQLRDTYN